MLNNLDNDIEYPYSRDEVMEHCEYVCSDGCEWYAEEDYTDPDACQRVKYGDLKNVFQTEVIDAEESTDRNRVSAKLLQILVSVLLCSMRPSKIGTIIWD